MKKNLTIVTGVLIFTLFLSGCSAQKTESTPESTPSQHEDGTAHTEGDTHQDESQPHTDVTPHATVTVEVKGDDSERKPASVDDHVDTAPHAEDEPHN